MKRDAPQVHVLNPGTSQGQMQKKKKCKIRPPGGILYFTMLLFFVLNTTVKISFDQKNRRNPMFLED